VLYRLSSGTIPTWFHKVMLFANPMAVIATSYQAAFYDHQLPDLKPLAAVAALSVVLLTISAGIFQRRQEEFAELI
jgi:lipopolysaccharide transport system permease protein